jgi:hypothetical protein
VDGLPPPAVKTIRDVILYQYAKMIASEAGYRGNYAFIMSRFSALKSGRMSWSNLTREFKHEISRGHSCVYCGSASGIQLDHVIPISKGGPDTADNMVMVCRACNASKGDKDLYHWWVYEKHLDKDEIPRAAVGRYLKLIYDMHNMKGTLDRTDLDGDGKPTVFDLGFIVKRGYEVTNTAQGNGSLRSSVKIASGPKSWKAAGQRAKWRKARRPSQKKDSRLARERGRPKSSLASDSLMEKVKRRLGL